MDVTPSDAQSGKAPPKVDTTVYKDNYLELIGTIYRFVGEAEKDDKLPPLDSALITVSTVEGPFTRVFTNKKGKCNIKLPLNRTFKILVSKKGYVPKFFEVNTKLSTNKVAAYTFKFDVDIFEEIKKLDVAVLKKPIAKVNYDPIDDRFHYDDSYTSRVNFELKKMYKDYYIIRQNELDSIAKFNKALPPEEKGDGKPQKTNNQTKQTKGPAKGGTPKK
jgi:hypothetical protein